MPELPEVETTLRGITPHILQHKIQKITIRCHQLRWPIPAHLANTLKNMEILSIERRAKYLLFHTAIGTLILHLGMSGSLRVLTTATPFEKHDHVDMLFENNILLRYTDPRRFGAILWTTQPIEEHTLFKTLGPEPLDKKTTGRYLYERAAHKKIAIKSFLMDNHVIVGVGNIYATESLFKAGIHPGLSVQKISLKRYQLLMKCIKSILKAAILQGGTTLKDFLNSDGKPGYFKVHLKVYGREGEPCVNCDTPLQSMRLGQRSSVFCPICQT